MTTQRKKGVPNKSERPDSYAIPAIELAMWRFVVLVLRFFRRLVLRPRLLFFLLLALLELLLLLVMFLFELLQLFLLAFLGLLLRALIFLLLLNFLLLLHLLLFDLLPFLVLLLAQSVQLLLVFLIELRIDRRRYRGPRCRRAIAIGFWIRRIAATGFHVVIGNGRRTIRIGSRLRRTILLYRWIGLILWRRHVRPVRVDVCVLRSHRLRGRRDVDVRARNFGLNLARLRNTDGSAAIRLNGRLLLRKRCGRRRRRVLCHDGPAGQCCRRLHRCSSAGTEHAALLRDNAGASRCNASRKVAFVDAHHVVVHRLRGCKRGLRRRCDGVVNVLILVRNVRHVHSLVHVNVVVDVRDLRAIDNRRIRNVHVLHVRRADVIRRAIDVTWSKREPRHANGWRSAD